MIIAEWTMLLNNFGDKFEPYMCIEFNVGYKKPCFDWNEI